MSKCNVCGKEGETTVCCSSMGAVSFAYCNECLQGGYEPYGAIVSFVSCIGDYNDIVPVYQDIIEKSLRHLHISKENFIKDIKNS